MHDYQKQEGGLRLTNNEPLRVDDLNSPLVSIVTCVRDMEKTIERTILSVVNQTYINIEYILIDGGSKDKTLDIIKRYESRINYWVSEPDRGISDAFNKGISLCSGELIGIINGDDWYELYAVEKVVKAYVQDKSAGVIHGKMQLYEKGQPLFVLACPKKLDKLWINMILNHPTCFVTALSYKKFGGFDQSYKVSMDYELMLRFYIHGVKFCYVESILANYSFGGESDLGEVQSWKEGQAIHAKYGYSKYFLQYWFKLTIRRIKRFVRKRLGRNHPILVMIRKITKEQS